MIKKLLLFSTIVLFNSCVQMEDYEDLSIEIDTSLPLGDLTIDEGKLFELASVGEGGFVYVDDVITFQGESGDISFVNSKDLEEVLEIESNISFTENKILDITQLTQLSRFGVVNIEIPEETKILDLELNSGVKIDEAALSNGTLSVFVQPIDGVDVSNLVFTINELVLDKNPIVTSSNSGAQPTVIDLNGYKLKPSEGGRAISIKYNGFISIDKSIVSPTLTQIPLNISVKMEGADVFEAKGFFGRQEFTPIVQDVDLGDNSSSEFFDYIDEFSIANPSISMEVISDVNIPILVRIDNIYSVSTINGRRVRKEMILQDEFNKNRFLIDSKNNTILINNSIFEGNNVLSAAITKNLTGLEVNITPVVNPTVEQDGIPTEGDGINEFNVNNSVVGELVYSIPLSGSFKNINITDTLSMDAGSSDYDINEISLAILAENTFPLDIALSLYAIDDHGMIAELTKESIEIPSVVENLKPGAGVVINPGIVDVNNVKIITLDEIASKQFMEAKDILFKINASSMNPNDLPTMPTISFYRNSSLKMKMVLGVKGEIQFESDSL